MAEDWTAIAAEAAVAIAEVGFSATLEKPGAVTGPVYDPTFGAATTSTVTVVDMGIKSMPQEGTTILRRARVLMIGAAGTAPAVGDRVQVRSIWHEILAVRPTAPGGVDLLFNVEVAA